MNNPLDRIARSQYGLATIEQLRRVATVDEITTMTARGDLLRVRRGVYRLRGAPESWEQSMLAAILGAPSGAVASHRAAGRIWNLPGCDRALVELTVPYQSSSRLPDAIVHRSLSTTQIEFRRFKIPITGICRTLIELSAVMPPAQLGPAFDDALDRRLTTVDELHRVLDQMGSNGRRRTLVVRELLEKRSATRYEISEELHRRTIRYLERAGITDFETEYRVHVGGRRRYIDIAWPDEMVALEVDGFAAHRSRSAFDNDRNRNNWIAASGFRILHVTSATSADELVRWVTAVRALSSFGS